MIERTWQGDGMIGWAYFSDDERHRYLLGRDWSESAKPCSAGEDMTTDLEKT